MDIASNCPLNAHLATIDLRQLQESPLVQWTAFNTDSQVVKVQGTSVDNVLSHNWDICITPPSLGVQEILGKWKQKICKSQKLGRTQGKQWLQDIT